MRCVMRKPYKMNLLYLLSFILLCVCFMVFIFAVIFIIRYDNKLIGELIAVIGVALCLISIVLAMFSKPKRRRSRNKKQDKT